MLVLIVIISLMIIAILVRFIHPSAAYWLRDLVVVGRINRELISAAKDRGALGTTNFAAQLERTLRTRVVASNARAMKVRCMRIREVLSLLGTRPGTHTGDTRPTDPGGTLLELADMLQVLSSRVR